MSVYDISGSALSAFGAGMNVTAHNIANISTDDFQAWSRNYAARDAGKGVTIQVRSGNPFPIEEDVVNFDVLNAEVNQALPGINQPDNADDIEPEDLQTENDLPPDLNDKNNVDLAREMVNSIADQRGFEANAVVIATVQDMDAELFGMIMDQRV